MERGRGMDGAGRRGWNEGGRKGGRGFVMRGKFWRSWKNKKKKFCKRAKETRNERKKTQAKGQPVKRRAGCESGERVSGAEGGREVETGGRRVHKGTSE